MKKLMMTVACAAAAMAMTGCSRSPSSVAEKFAEAVIERDVDEAIDCVDTTIMSEKEIKDAKEGLDATGKRINDTKLEVEAIKEIVRVPSDDSGYTLKNGKKYTGEKAEVTIQFIKGKDKKSSGMNVKLEKVDGSWKVSNYEPYGDM